MAETRDFKFGTRLGFAKAHHKNHTQRNSGRGLTTTLVNSALRPSGVAKSSITSTGVKAGKSLLPGSSNTVLSDGMLFPRSGASFTYFSYLLTVG